MNEAVVLGRRMITFSFVVVSWLLDWTSFIFIFKVVLKIRENEYDDLTVPIAAIPRLYCDPNHVYIIPGGLGGFGLELADWLVIRGARKLILSSSRGITKSYQSYRIK